MFVYQLPPLWLQAEPIGLARDQPGIANGNLPLQRLALSFAMIVTAWVVCAAGRHSTLSTLA
jgi:hypothetical protein